MRESDLTVLHLDTGRELRGGQWQVIRLMRGLRKLGRHQMLLARAGSPLLEFCRKERFKADEIGIVSLRFASKMAHVIHAHDAHAHSLAALWSSRPLVVSRRVTFPVGRGPVSRWKYGRARMYAAVSETVAGELRTARVPETRIRVVYDGVPLLPDKWDPKGPVVVPRFADSRKDSPLALEAVAAANAPVIRSSKLEADLQGASLLVYLTQSEGLGSAALLAMSAGIPVVASNIGGLREVVRHGETGLLTANAVDAAKAAILRIRNDSVLGRSMSVRSREVVAESFSEDRMVAETLAIYQGVRKKSE